MHFSCKIGIEKLYFSVIIFKKGRSKKKEMKMLQKNRKTCWLFTGVIFLGVFAFSLNAQEKGKKVSLTGRDKRYAEFSQLPDPAVIAAIDRKKLQELNGKKLSLLKKMHVTRMELIKKDQRLSALRKKILSLSLELSQELNAKQEMFKLNNDLAILEDEIRELVKKNTPARARRMKY